MPKNIDKIKLLFILMCAKVYMNCKTPGYQWHPEMIYKKERNHLKLFKDFVDNCKK